MSQRELPTHVFRAAQSGDEHARERIVAHYLPYIKRVCKLYFRELRSDFEDHVGIAMLGLTRAMGNYDPAKNDSFARYAAIYVKRLLMAENTKNARRFNNSVYLTSEQSLEDVEPIPVHTPSVQEWVEIMEDLLSHPDEAVRSVVEMIAFGGHSLKEAAQELRISQRELQWTLQQAVRTKGQPLSIINLTGSLTTELVAAIDCVVIYGTFVPSKAKPIQLNLFDDEAA
jgi:RNA polymerase sigma factor (sigma-70 family)